MESDLIETLGKNDRYEQETWSLPYVFIPVLPLLYKVTRLKVVLAGKESDCI